MSVLFKKRKIYIYIKKKTLLEFKFKRKKDVDLAVSIFIFDYIYCLLILFSCSAEGNVCGLCKGGSAGMIFTASQACSALFSECDPHACVWSSFTSCSLLLTLLSSGKHSLLKPLSYFQLSSPGFTQAHLQLVWLTSQCVGVRMWSRVTVWMCRSPRQRTWTATEAWCSTPSYEHYSLSQGVTHLYQTACGTSLLGCVQVEFTARPQKLEVDVFSYRVGPYISHHRPLCGASCFCSPPPLLCGKMSQSDPVRLPSKNEACSDLLRHSILYTMLFCRTWK